MSHDLLAPYALDAVTAAERVAVERHLMACDECARELDEMRGALVGMARAELDAVEPEGAFTTAVFAVVNAAPPVAARTRSSWVRGKLGSFRPPRLALGLAAAVLVVASVAVVMQARVTAERDRADRIAAVLAAPDARLVTAAAAGGGEVAVLVSASRSTAVVTVRDLPEVGRDRAYQLWLIHDGRPTSVGLLASGTSDGIRIVGDVTGAQTLGVTNEPAGGSRAPTLPLVATVDL